MGELVRDLVMVFLGDVGLPDLDGPLSVLCQSPSSPMSSIASSLPRHLSHSSLPESFACEGNRSFNCFPCLLLHGGFPWRQSKHFGPIPPQPPVTQNDRQGASVQTSRHPRYRCTDARAARYLRVTTSRDTTRPLPTTHCNPSPGTLNDWLVQWANWA